MLILWPCVCRVHLTYIFVLKGFLAVLHPKRKMDYFEKHWDKELCKDVLTVGKEAVCSNIATICLLLTFTKFKKHYEQLEAANSTSSESKTLIMTSVKWWKTEGHLRDIDSDDSDDKAGVPEPSSNPWMIEFEQYMKTNDIIPPSMAVVMWWGVRAQWSWSSNHCVLIYYLVKHIPLSNCKFTGSWLFRDYGIFCLKWTCILVSWPYN